MNMAWEEKRKKISGEFSLKLCSWENLTENEWDEVEKKEKREARERPNTHILHIFAMPKMST